MLAPNFSLLYFTDRVLSRTLVHVRCSSIPPSSDVSLDVTAYKSPRRPRCPLASDELRLLRFLWSLLPLFLLLLLTLLLFGGNQCPIGSYLDFRFLARRAHVCLVGFESIVLRDGFNGGDLSLAGSLLDGCFDLGRERG